MQCEMALGTMEPLLTKGASIEAMDRDNHTPLHLVAKNGYSSTIELLLGIGTSIEAVGQKNNTPLHLPH